MKRSVALDAVNGFFTSGTGNLGGNMKSRDLDIDYLFLLEALEGGVDPGPELVDTLEQMGLVERTPSGFVLTMDAQVKLANLRSLMRRHPMPE